MVEFSDKLFEKEWCKNGHIGFVIEGKVKVTFFNGHIVEFKKGDFISIPEGEKDKHKAEMEKGEKVLVLFFI